MWWHNVLGDNKGIISHLLWLDPITADSVLLAAKIFEMKRENPEPTLIMKIIEWSKLIYCLGVIIEAGASSVGKNKVYIFSVLVQY